MKMHTALLKSDPEVAERVKEAVMAELEGGFGFGALEEPGVAFVVSQDWPSTRELAERFPRLKDPAKLEVLAKLAKDKNQPPSVQRGAATWLSKLTGGTVAPEACTAKQLDDQANRKWRWDEASCVFVVEQ